MQKQSYSQRYQLFLASLRTARKSAGLTQVEAASRLKDTQTFVSKCERGERRVDVIELLDFLELYGADAPSFIRDLQLQFAGREKK